MRRREALLAAAAGALAVGGGLVWLAGPYGLIGSGAALLAVLFLVDVKED